jgi:hypothetical protein
MLPEPSPGISHTCPSRQTAKLFWKQVVRIAILLFLLSIPRVLPAVLPQHNPSRCVSGPQILRADLSGVIALPIGHDAKGYIQYHNLAQVITAPMRCPVRAEK